jgi:hypothetical protein
MYSDIVLKYDSIGRFQGTFGRRGQGPGEFERIHALHVDNLDTLYLFDYNLSRMSVFAPNDSFVRAMAIPRAQPLEAIKLSDRDWVFAAMIFSPSRTGLPLQHVRDGEIVRSFGAQNPALLPGNDQAAFRHIARAAGANLVWSSMEDRYQLELWSMTGVLHRVLVRRAQWFPAPPPIPAPADSMRPPPPLVRRIIQRSDSLIAVLAYVSDANWRPSPELALLPNVHRAFDTVIELIRPSDGRLITSARFDEFISGFLPGGDRVYGVRLDGDVMVVDIWQVVLTR